MDTTPLQPVARTGRSHTIVRTFLDKRGRVTTSTTGIVGGTDKEALHHFRDHVASAATRRNLLAVVVVTTAGEKLGEWSRTAETAVA